MHVLAYKYVCQANDSVEVYCCLQSTNACAGTLVGKNSARFAKHNLAIKTFVNWCTESINSLYSLSADEFLHGGIILSVSIYVTLSHASETGMR